MRLPQTPEQRRQKAAERQRRRRERLAVEKAVDGAMGLGPEAPLPENLTPKRLSEYLHQRALENAQAMGDGALMAKEMQPFLKTGLQAETIIDKRKAVEAKTGGADLAYALIKWLAGENPPETKQLGDGNTIEGEFTEADPDAPE